MNKIKFMIKISKKQWTCEPINIIYKILKIDKKNCISHTILPFFFWWIHYIIYIFYHWIFLHKIYDLCINWLNFRKESSLQVIQCDRLKTSHYTFVVSKCFVRLCVSKSFIYTTLESVYNRQRYPFPGWS